MVNISEILMNSGNLSSLARGISQGTGGTSSGSSSGSATGNGSGSSSGATTQGSGTNNSSSMASVFSASTNSPGTSDTPESSSPESSSPESSSSDSPDIAYGPSAYTQMDQNFFNYASMYKSPKEVNNSPQNLMGYYADALITGSTSPSPIFQKGYSADAFPGNRYFINTNTKCMDNDGIFHERSVLIDNVNESIMDDYKPSERGLMYSFFASLGSLDIMKTPSVAPAKSSAPGPSSAPSAITIVDSNTIPRCQLAKVRSSDQEDSQVIQAYVTEKDYGKIDAKALENFTTQEGFATPWSDKFHSTMVDTHSKMVSHGSTALSGVTSAKNSAEQAKTNLQNKSKESVAKAKETGDNYKQQVANAKKKSEESAKSRLENSYNEEYSKEKIDMSDLFDKFFYYKDANGKQISPLCLYYTFDQVNEDSIQNEIPNANAGKQGYTNNSQQIQPGKFFSELKKYSKINAGLDPNIFGRFVDEEMGPNTSGESVNISKKYIPPQTICETLPSLPSIQAVPKCGVTNPNYTLFWNALEPLRQPIINTIMTLDNPDVMGTCPPKSYNPRASENFEPMRYSHIEKQNNESQLLFLLLLFVFMIFMMIVFYVMQ